MRNNAIRFFTEKVSLKKMAEKAIVVNGLAKNNKLETIGFVIFKPKKLHNKAKNMIRAIIITFMKFTFNAFPIFSCFLATRTTSNAVKKTTSSWLEMSTMAGTLADKFFQ